MMAVVTFFLTQTETQSQEEEEETPEVGDEKVC